VVDIDANKREAAEKAGALATVDGNAVDALEQLTKKAGVIVVGSNTYKTFPGPLKERLNIVYSRSGTGSGAHFEGEDGQADQVEITQDPPADLLKKLETRGFKEAAICGGESIYTMFMKAKVVNRLFLTIEPIILGKGVRLFNDDMLFHLKLVSAVESENGALLLEYMIDYTGNPKVS